MRPPPSSAPPGGPGNQEAPPCCPRSSSTGPATAFCSPATPGTPTPSRPRSPRGYPCLRCWGHHQEGPMVRRRAAVAAVPETDQPPPPEPLVVGVAKALSPLARRILAPNPGLFTGPGTNTYLVG